MTAAAAANKEVTFSCLEPQSRNANYFSNFSARSGKRGRSGRGERFVDTVWSTTGSSPLHFFIRTHTNVEMGGRGAAFRPFAGSPGDIYLLLEWPLCLKHTRGHLFSCSDFVLRRRRFQVCAQNASDGNPNLCLDGLPDEIFMLSPNPENTRF
jgi:hypothetical protein